MALSPFDSRSLCYPAALAALCIVLSGAPAAAKATFVTFGDSVVTGINSANTVTGWQGDGDSFIRTVDGTFTTFVVSGASATVAARINDEDVVVGFYRDSAGRVHGFARASDGAVTTFDVPQATGTGPSGVNKKGDITGSYDDEAGTHGFVRTARGRLTTFDVSGANFTSPGCINDKGVTSGIYSLSDGHLHGFVRAPGGEITTIDVPGAVTTSVDCINVKGTVAGSYDIGDGIRHGFVRETDGTITTFDGQDCDISPTSINRKGLVTGWCIDHQKPSHILGFVRKPDGTINEFHVPNGGSNTMPYGINDAGVIAGSYHSGGFLRFP